MTSQKSLGKATQAIHAGEARTSSTQKTGMPLLPPIYQNSTFRFATAAECAEAFQDEESGYVYTRWGNPTQEVLEQKLAVLEAGEAALATASGMGAVSTALLTALAEGGHVVAMENLYSATFQILNEELPRFGIETTFVDATDPTQIAHAIRADTKVLYLESPTNPLLKLVDLQAAAEIAKAHGVISMIDNTFATPCGQQPITFGIDVVVHSMTKYMSGSGAVIAGAIIGQKEFIVRAKEGALRNFGAVISPFNAWLTLHGLTTLPLRFARHSENATRVAAFLEAHPAAAWVRHPSLPNHPQHELAKRQMDAFGGMITLELKGGRAAGEHLVDHLQLCSLAVSLGDVRTLICHPASTTHSHVPAEIRRQTGITDGLVRISIGLEDTEDIIADLGQALETCAP
ncbi:aminotransferase class I/II-fold pyridoxal phosphate-dependent enzyme [Candidatus Poribacteria bacterium]|nr:aminotransferase class I/II-fold pyridoxal phosphate-dependent enzyme [Candidatus Poribacteria bacterium]MYA55883.1 aminotransferase class I/II-fold pyridoxal phosphate-dependent enzyme [Candidatus Poribacteria bacterium]